MAKYETSRYIVVGEYPEGTEGTNDIERDDIKVLDFCDSLRDAQKSAGQFIGDGYTFIHVYKIKEETLIASDIPSIVES